MNRVACSLKGFYNLLLSLYPQAYKVEYGEELGTVFNLVIDEAAQQGVLTVLRIGWREMSGIPGAVCREHLRARRKKGPPRLSGLFPTFESGSRREMLAASAPFLTLGALASLAGYLHLDVPPWLGFLAGLLLFMLPILYLFLLGLIKGLPRWFLPYVGVVGAVLSLLWSNEFLYRFYPVYVWDPWIKKALFGGMRPWVGLIFGAIGVVLITALFPPLRPAFRRIRRDWTLLSFGLYGAALFALYVTFDDYRNEEPIIIAASLILAVGAGAYLQSDSFSRRFLALFVGLTLCTAVAAIGKALIFPSQGFPGRFPWHGEVLSTVRTFGRLAVVVLAPSLLGLFSRSKDRYEDGSQQRLSEEGL